MEPTQALTLKELIIGDKHIPEDKLIWVLSQSDTKSYIEYKNIRGHVPNDAIVPYPVPRPSLNELRKHDACFGLPESAFEIEIRDQDHWFTIYRCKAHGSRFLEDSRGGIAIYGLFILLDDSDKEASPYDTWSKYHHISKDKLYLQCRAY